jgi:hypothetical protein
MDNTGINLEKSSAIWDSNKGTGSEDPCGAAKQNPVEQGVGGTPLTREERLSIEGQTLKNLKCLAEKVCTLGL